MPPGNSQERRLAINVLPPFRLCTATWHNKRKKKQPKFQNHHFLTRSFCPGKIAKLKGGHCRDPLPPMTRGAHLYPGPLGGHTTLSNIIPRRCSILSGFIVWIIDCKKQALLSHPRQPITAHVPPPAERKDRSNGKSLPTISNSRLQGDDDFAFT